jgi:hypothetical protein
MKGKEKNMGTNEMRDVGYFVNCLYTTRIKCITYIYRDIFNVIIVYISHLMMAQEGRNM